MVNKTGVDCYPTTHISLCSGCAGLDLGLRAVIPSLRTVLYVEIEAFNCSNLAQKMQDNALDEAPIWTDLTSVPVEGFRDKVFAISGGYPCQPFSFCGKREGEQDKAGRHLWPSCRRTVRAIRPVFCLWENVEGHISLGLSTVISDMEEDGYRTTWGLFSAQVDAEAPHQRKRVFILGLREDVDPEIFKQICPELADPDNSRLERWFCEEEREHDVERREPCGKPPTQGSGGGATVADAESRKPRKQETRNRGESLGRGGKKLADTNDERPQGERPEGDTGRRSDEDVSSGLRSRTKWPSRPSQPQQYWEPPRTIEVGKAESSMGGDSDGATDRMGDAELYISCDNRVDELRTLGNSVVPQCVSSAFLQLAKRLIQLK